MTTLPSTTGTQVQIRRGTEGPRHDPYAYTETTIRRNGHEAVVHFGLANWLKVDGKPVFDSIPDDGVRHRKVKEKADRKLLASIGLDFETLVKVEDYVARKPLRCKCGRCPGTTSDGFAGELIVCVRCHEVVGTQEPSGIE